eukprot:jgi/Chlat1/7474/Chrsp6S09192
MPSPAAAQAVPTALAEPPAVDEQTLVVRQLPLDNMGLESTQRVLAHYGALSVRPCGDTGRLRSAAFVTFASKDEASDAQKKLNGLKMMGKALQADFVTAVKQERKATPPAGPQIMKEHATLNTAYGLGMDFAPNANLEYSYPPPDPNILHNIVNTMIAVPRLYTQVLHLMNKMNLPPPFGPPLPPPGVVQKRPRDERVVHGLEGDEEESDEEAHEPVKAPRVEVAPYKPSAAAPVIKLKRPVVEIKLRPAPLALADALKPLGDTAPVQGRADPEELSQLSAFKNYQPGEPTAVLYAKNLAKTVTVQDLRRICGRHFPSDADVEQQLSIRLMQEGRMKGQAFITFPSVELATAALEEAHRFKLHEKPIALQFGKGAKTITQPQNAG